MTVTIKGRLASKTGATGGIGRLLCSTALVGVVILTAPQMTSAQDRYYDFGDLGGGGSGNGLNPTDGTWNNTDMVWAGNDDGGGGGAPFTFESDNTAVFRHDTNDSTTTVTVEGNITTDGMRFEQSGTGTSFVIQGDSSDGVEDVLRAETFGDDVAIAEGVSVTIDIRSENGFDYNVLGNLDLTTDGAGIDDVTVDGTGAATINTRWGGALTDIAGDVTVASPTSTLTVRSLGIDDASLVNNGTTILQGALRLTEDANTPIVDNRGTLEFEGGGSIIGGITNTSTGTIALEADGLINAGASSNGIVNNGTIETVGGPRTLTLRGEADNTGTLDATAGRLTLVVDDLTLGASTVFFGDVLLQGGVTNQIAGYDMVHIPTMMGDFINEASVTLANGVAGGGHDLINRDGASFSTTDDSVTGLASASNAGTMNVQGTATISATGNIVNSGNLTVGAAATLSGAQIIHQEEAAGAVTNAALASTGTLVGDVRVSADADLANSIQGDLLVSGGTTQITDDLAVTVGGATSNGRVRVQNGATLELATDAELNAAGGLVVSDATSELALGTNGAIVGNVDIGSRLTGIGSVTGNMTLSSAFQSINAGLAVSGQLTNQATNQVALLDFASFSADNIVNQADLVMDRAYTGDVTTTTGSTLSVDSAMTGRLVTDGTTSVAADIENTAANNALFVRAGTTTIDGDVTISAAVAEAVVVNSAGTLNVTGGDLEVAGSLRSQGNVTVGSGRTVEASRMDFAQGTATINGSLIGSSGPGSADIVNGASSDMTLDGATISGSLTNRGDINWPVPAPSTTGRKTVILNGLTNEGRATIGQTGLAATVRGAVSNSGTLNIIGGVYQSAGGVASVTNSGDLSIIGRVAGDVTSTGGNLTLSGPIDGTLSNAGDATVDGNVGGDVTNTGTLAYRGTIAGAITNTGAGASLTTTGQVTASSITNSGDMTVASGTRVLTSGAGPTIDSQAGSLTVAGRVEGDVDAADGSDLTVAAGGVITGALDSAANTTIAGQIGGTTTLQSGGDLTLNGAARLDGLTAADGSTVTVSGGANTVVRDFTNSSRNSRILGTLTGDVINTAGPSRITIGGSGTIDGTLENAAGATVVTNGTVTGNTTNAGTITLSGNAEFNGDLVNNNRIDQNVASATLTVDGTLTNNADIIAGAGQTMFVDAGIFVNGAGSTISGDVRMAGDVFNAGTLNWNTDGTLTGNITNLAGPPTAQINVSADMDGNGFDLHNNGAVDIAATGTLTNLDEFTNRGITTVAEGGVLGADAIINEGSGGLTSAGTLAGDVVNRSAASLTSTGDITGRLTNLGTASISGGAGTVINNGSGVLTVTDTLTATGNLVNRSTVSIEQGTTSFDQVTNNGDLTLATGARLNSDSMVNRGTATLDGVFTGSLTNAGTVTAAGNLNVAGNTASGTITADGHVILAYNSGEITANSLSAGDLSVDNRGTLNIAGDFENRRPGTEVFRNHATATFGGNVAVDTVNLGTLSVGGDIASLISQTGASASIGRHVLGDALNKGNLTVSGRVGGNLTTNDGATSIISRAVSGDAVNSGLTSIGGNLGGSAVNRDGSMTIGGLVRGDVSNLSDSGSVTVSGTVGGDVINAGSTDIGGAVAGNVTNRAGMTTIGGAVGGDVANQSASGSVTVDGDIGGDLANAGTTTLRGNVGGAINNGGTLNYGPTLTAQSLSNTALFVVATSQSVTLDGSASNFGPNGDMRIFGSLSAGAGLTNHDGGTLMAGGASTITANVSNIGEMSASGRINGSVTNTGDLTLGGRVTGDVVHAGGSLTQQSGLQIDGSLILGGGSSTVAGALGARAVGSAATLMAEVDAETEVPAGVTTTIGEELIIASGGSLTLDGRLNAASTEVRDGGTMTMTGTLESSLITRGTSALAGSILGDLTYADGSMTVTDDLNVTGNVALNRDFTLDSGVVLSAGTTNVAADVLAEIMGTLNSDVRLAGQMDLASGGRINGDVALADGAALAMNGDIGGVLNVANGAEVTTSGSRSVGGALVNNGTVDMADGTVGDTLTVGGGLSGTGVYALDIDLSGDTGRADRIAVTGGATTGNITLDFAVDSTAGVSDRAKRLLVLDADGPGSTATVTANGLPAASERIIYRLAQDSSSGDWFVRDGVNDAISAIVGNVVLTQSLIGSVVNRPTSPFVQGLAAEDDDPCGVGTWARATAGRADATGSSVSNDQVSSSSISARYAGIQFGADFACFQGHYKGWDMAFGVIGGLNDGSTSQPIYRQSNGEPTDLIDSMNAADFRQTYGGVYMTASRDRLSADVQLRQEKTDFTVNNTPATGQTNGLGLTDTKFSSDATTLSGSLSYAMPLPRDGWQFVPTAGFAWSRTSTDTIVFDEVNGLGSQLAIDDSESRVGFVGGTVSRTFVNSAGNAAVNAFGTATVYRDFASDTESTYTMFNEDGSVFREDRLSSSNLGTYGEISVGANYIRLLNSGSAGRPRQLNAAVRVDGRTGESLDSYGLTAQLRLQF